MAKEENNSIKELLHDNKFFIALEEIDKIKKENADLKKRVEDLLADKLFLNTTIQGMKADREVLFQEFSDTLIKNDGLVLKKDYDELETENSNLNEYIDNLKENEKDLIGELELYQNENAKLKEENKKLQCCGNCQNIDGKCMQDRNSKHCHWKLSKLVSESEESETIESGGQK